MTLTTSRLCSGPALPEQAKLDAIIARLSGLTPEEVVALSVKTGIHLPSGELAPEYRKVPK